MEEIPTTGEHDLTLDDKNRVAAPLDFRALPTVPGAMWSEFVMTRGTEECIFVYTPDAWNKVREAVLGDKALPDAARRRFQRLMDAGAVVCRCDRQGRVVIPEKLREYAGVKREVTWIRTGDRTEIWDTAKWREYLKESLELLQETFEKVAEDQSKSKSSDSGDS